MGQSWYKEFGAVCAHIGFPLPGNVDTKINISVFKHVKEKCQVKQYEEWRLAIANKPKLRSYIKFKCQYKVEDYCTLNMLKSKRSLLAQLRLGVLQLQVEVGRFHGTPLDKRTCQLCDMNVVEDELHLLCVCPLYQVPRQLLYNRVALLNDNTQITHFKDLHINDQFICLMQNYQKYVACYLNDAWNIRKEKLYKKQ